MKARVSYENAYGAHPVTLNLLLPYWGMLLGRATRQMVWHPGAPAHVPQCSWLD